MKTNQFLCLLFFGAVFSLSAFSERDAEKLSVTKIDYQTDKQYPIDNYLTDNTIATTSVFPAEEIVEIRDNLGHGILSIIDNNEVHPLFEIVGL